MMHSNYIQKLHKRDSVQQRTLGRFIFDVMNIKSEGQNEQIGPFNV